jgi:hypothetical protein
MLRLPEGQLVCPALVVRVIELHAIVFPEADGAKIVRAGRLLIERLIAATRARVFPVRGHESHTEL